QPFPTAPPPFARQRFTAADVSPNMLTSAEQQDYKQRIEHARNEGLFTPIGFSDVIHMPGNQGGSNWGGTAANPIDGTVYACGFNIPSILRLVRPEEGGRGARGGAGLNAGAAVYQRDCQACHGAGRAGSAEAPALIGIAARMAPLDIRDLVVTGRGR